MAYRLTRTQKEVLEALVKLYEKTRRMVKSKEIAELIGRDEGTVRNIILSLKSLGLIESKTGPTGGCMPTLKAYEVLRGVLMPVALKLKKRGEETNIVVIGVELLDPFNPAGGRAVLRVYGDLSTISVGDYVSIGPTPFARIIIEGEVLFIDATTSQLSIVVRRLVSIPRIDVGKLTTRRVITVEPDQPLSEVAAILSAKKIKGAPVVEGERLVGIITQTDIIRAIAEDNLDARVRDYMSSPVVTIREDEDVLKAIELMNYKMVGRLVVVDSQGRLAGIITRTDVLKYIAGLE